MGLPSSSSGEPSKSAIADVPFTLGCNTELLSSLRELGSSDLLTQKTFDSNCYEYDFSLEMKFLTEYGSFSGDMDWQGY